MRARLAGNHSAYHCGCAAVWQALNLLARSKGWTIAKSESDYDALIINGEGSMHHSSAAFHRKMAVIRDALDSGKDAYLVNTVWQENSGEYDDLLRRLTGISVRDVISQKDLLERHGIRSRVNIDLSYFAPIRPTWLHRRYGNAVVTTDFWVSTKKKFLIIDEFARLPRVKMKRRSWDSFVSSLKSSRLLVTGRHHAVYGACKAGIPFVASEGNTHKISGLIATSGIDIPMARTVDELPETLARVERSPERFQDLFKWMQAQSPHDAIPNPGERWQI